MTPSELANRFSNYADAVVAFSILNALAFMQALGEEDIRAGINEAPSSALLIGLVLSAVFYTLLVCIFRYAELKLRREAAESSTPTVERYQRYFQVARITVIWMTNGIVVLLYLRVV